MSDANGWPAGRRASVASVPVRPSYASVRARSANVGSGTAGAPPPRRGPAGWLRARAYARPQASGAPAPRRLSSAHCERGVPGRHDEADGGAVQPGLPLLLLPGQAPPLSGARIVPHARRPPRDVRSPAHRGLAGRAGHVRVARRRARDPRARLLPPDRRPAEAAPAAGPADREQPADQRPPPRRGVVPLPRRRGLLRGPEPRRAGGVPRPLPRDPWRRAHAPGRPARPGGAATGPRPPRRAPPGPA